MRRGQGYTIRFHVLCFIATVLAVSPMLLIPRTRFVLAIGYVSYSGVSANMGTYNGYFELYRLKFGHPPDLSQGWDFFVRNRWLQAEPVCWLGWPYDRSNIALSREEVRSSEDAAWIYDAEKGRLLAVISADYARYFPIRDITDYVVVPSPPIRTPLDLFRPLSRTRPFAMAFMTLLGCVILTLVLERLVLESAVWMMTHRWWWVVCLWVALGAGLDGVWQSTRQVNWCGRPDAPHYASGFPEPGPELIVYPLATLLVMAGLTHMALSSDGERRRVARLALARRRRAAQRATMRGRCLRCGYDVRANAQRCSECGLVLPLAVRDAATGLSPAS